MHENELFIIFDFDSFWIQSNGFSWSICFLLEKRLQEVQRLHFEEQIDELQRRLVETEEKNQYLMRTIDQMNQAALKDVESIASPDAGPVLLPDPKLTISFFSELI